MDADASSADKVMFKAKRYMDDILLVYARPDWWDHAKFLSERFRGVAVLEDGGDISGDDFRVDRSAVPALPEE